MEKVFDVAQGYAKDCGEWWPEDEAIPVAVEISLRDGEDNIGLTWTPPGAADCSMLVVPIDRLKRLLAST